MKVFVRNALAATALSVEDLADATRAFFLQMEAEIAEHPQWTGCEHSELERANDGVEKFVMTRLHDRVFAADAAEASIEDSDDEAAAPDEASLGGGGGEDGGLFSAAALRPIRWIRRALRPHTILFRRGR